MIIRGGENISPREIEEFLYRHPAVLDVAVVGVPDAKFGEEVCACIRLREGMSADRGGDPCVLPRADRAFQDPRYVRFVDAFPLTVTGKVQKLPASRPHARQLGLIVDP